MSCYENYKKTYTRKENVNFNNYAQAVCCIVNKFSKHQNIRRYQMLGSQPVLPRLFQAI